MKKKLPQYFVLLLLFLISVLFFWLIRDYLMSMFWAIVLSLMFKGLFLKLNIKFKGRRALASIVTVVIALIMILTPIALIVVMLVYESEGLADLLNSDINLQQNLEAIQNILPFEKEAYHKYGLSPTQINDKANLFMNEGSNTILDYGIYALQNIALLIINFILMTYMFYFFMKDGNRVIKKTLWVMPIRDFQMQEIIIKFEKVTIATIKGSLVVALIQGVLGGFIFWMVGIQGALIWGAIMILASLLPAGTALIWLPWSLILIVQGDASGGIALIVFGVSVIMMIGNFLRPRLVGKDTKLPDYLILLSILGGLAGFGVSGFLIGPIIAALFVTLWEIIGKEFGTPYNEIIANDDRLISDIF